MAEDSWGVGLAVPHRLATRTPPACQGSTACAVWLLCWFSVRTSTTLSLGAEGVTLFFVLSGYLITSILLGYSGETKVAEAARVFYLRRLLRLAPVFYICIAVTALLGIGDMRETWWVNALYLSNIRVFLGPVFRSAMGLISRDRFALVPLPGSVDFLATGALLAYANRYCSDHPIGLRFKQWRMPLLMAFACVIGVSQIFDVFSFFAYEILCACVISAAAEPTRDWRLDWLGGRVIRHLGVISYSLYVWHYFVLQLLGPLHFVQWSRSNDLNRLTNFAILSCISIAVAELSWRCIERPINSLRSRVVPRVAERVPSSTAAAVQSL